MTYIAYTKYKEQGKTYTLLSTYMGHHHLHLNQRHPYDEKTYLTHSLREYICVY